MGNNPGICTAVLAGIYATQLSVYRCDKCDVIMLGVNVRTVGMQ